MKKIFKYKVEVLEHQLIKMPKGAFILSAHRQGDDIYIWAVVEIGLDDWEDVQIEVIGTGNAIVDREDGVRKFLGTVLMPNGYVWHVFRFNKK